MKILPLNINPMIRGYVHHLFINGILSREDSVGTLLASIKLIEKNDICQKYFIIGKKATFEIIENNIKLYTELYAPEAENLLYRVCNENDELIIKVNYQQYSRAWGSVCLFVSKQANLDCETFIDNCDMRLYRFCRDVVLCSGAKLENPLQFTDSTYPYWLKLSVTDNVISSYISSDGSNWIKKCHTKLQDDITEQRVIGICFNLQQNSYYDWLFSNYVHLIATPNFGIRLDLLIAPYKNYRPYTVNPLLNFSIIRWQEIETQYATIIEYLKMSIDAGKYIEVELNEFFVPSRSAYNTVQYAHHNLVYGYDSDNLYLLGIMEGKPFTSTISIKNFLSACEYEKKPENVIYEMDIMRDPYVFNVEFLRQSLISYLSGKLENAQVYNIYEDHLNDATFGINIYDRLMEQEYLDMMKDDIRITYVLFEHKKCMCERIKFLLTRGYLCNKSVKYTKLEKCVEETRIKSEQLLSILLKNKIKPTKAICAKIRRYLCSIKNLELVSYPLLIELLSDLS